PASIASKKSGAGFPAPLFCVRFSPLSAANTPFRSAFGSSRQFLIRLITHGIAFLRCEDFRRRNTVMKTLKQFVWLVPLALIVGCAAPVQTDHTIAEWQANGMLP